VEHLDDNAASEFVSGTLPPSAMGRVDGHLARCRECRALVAALAVNAGEDSNAATFRHERVTASQAGEQPRPTLSVGDRVGRYLVLSSIGAGGMGVVFAAYDPQLDRKIALKLLRSGLAVWSKDARTRLRREAQAIAQLSHPNVVSVYDVGTTVEGDLYIAMEFVEGDTLTSWLRKYPRTWREIIDVFLQAARGLHSAHRVGLLHRDFNPDNVLVGGDGRVRVTDFGLARSLLAPDEAMQPKPKSVMTALNQALTATGTVLGTPRYMPPEQLTGPDLDERSDQFSFCVALYEALYGSHPLPDGTSAAMIDHGARAHPPPEGTRIPAAIGRAVLRGLERDRARRFPSMGTLIDELVPRPRRSPLRFAGLGIGAVLLVGGTTTALVVQQQRAPLPPSDNQQASDKLHHLEQQIISLESERKRLMKLLVEAGIDQETNRQLREELQQKDAEIHELKQEVAELKASNTKLGDEVKKTRVANGQTVRINKALAAAQSPIEGCFREWAERAEVSEATLVVGLTVAPNGVGTMATIVSTPDKHPDPPGDDTVSGKSALEMCVSEQVTRVRFPSGSDRLDLEVIIEWSPAMVKLSSNVVHHQRVPAGQIELE
jgi:serine/threonine protein kinase